MADADNLRRLWRYKSDLEEGPDEEKLIEILGKLKKVPVTVASLKETGVGKLINRFTRKEGIVGSKAAAVVAIWKSTLDQQLKNPRGASPEPQESPSRERDNSESDTNSWDSFQRDSAHRGSGSALSSDGENVNQSEDRRHHHSRATCNQEKQKTGHWKDEGEPSGRKRQGENRIDKFSRREKCSEYTGKSHHAERRESPKNQSSSELVPSKKPLKQVEEEDLTDSDEDFGEEATDASKIEEYYRKMLEQSTGSSSHNTGERHKKDGGIEGHKKGEARDLLRESKDRSSNKDIKRHLSSSQEEILKSAGDAGLVNHRDVMSGHSSNKQNKPLSFSRDKHHQRESYPSKNNKTSGSHNHQNRDHDSSGDKERVTSYHSHQSRSHHSSGDKEKVSSSHGHQNRSHLSSGDKEKVLSSHSHQIRSLHSSGNKEKVSNSHSHQIRSLHPSGDKVKEKVSSSHSHQHRSHHSAGDKEKISGSQSDQSRGHHSSSNKEKVSGSQSDQSRRHHSSSNKDGVSGMSHNKLQSISERQHHKGRSGSIYQDSKTSHSDGAISDKADLRHKKVDRRQKRHSISDSDKEENEEQKEMFQSQREKYTGCNSNKVGAKDSTAKGSHSRSRGLGRHDAPHKHHSSDTIKVKKERNDESTRCSDKYEHRFYNPAGDNHAHNDLNVQTGHEHLFQTDEDLYSPKHVILKREKSWSPSQKNVHYSPTPIAGTHQKRRDESPADSASVKSYSPSMVSGQTSDTAPSQLDSDIDGEDALRYSPQKITRASRDKESSPRTPSWEATPSYNPTPIVKKERNISPGPSAPSGRSSSKNARLVVKDGVVSPSQRKRKLDHPCSESSDEESPDRRSISAAKMKHKSPRSSASLSPRVQACSSRESQPYSNIKQESLSAGSGSSDSEGGNPQQQFSAYKSSRDVSKSNTSYSSDEASVGYSPTLNPTEVTQEELSDSDASVSSVVSKHRNMKSEQVPSDLDSHEEDCHGDRYSPAPVSSKIKEEPYSPTPKSQCRTRDDTEEISDKSELRKDKHKFHNTKVLPSATHKVSSSESQKSSTERKKSIDSGAYHSSSSVEENKYKDSNHSSRRHKPSSSASGKSSPSSKKHISSATQHHSGEKLISKTPQSSQGLNSNSKHKNYKSNPYHSASERKAFSSSSARNSPTSRSDVSHVSSSSYPDMKRKSSGSDKHHHSNEKFHRSYKSSPSYESQHGLGNENSHSSDLSKSRLKSPHSSKSDPKTSSQAYKKISADKSTPKKSKLSKRKLEDPELDLFSDVLDFKGMSSPAPQGKPVHAALPSTKTSRKSESQSPTPAVSPPPRSKHRGRDLTSGSTGFSDDDLTDAAANDLSCNEDEEEKLRVGRAADHKKQVLTLNEKEEAEMSFEDFMEIDAEALRKRSKLSGKTTSSKRTMSSTLPKNHVNNKSNYLQQKSSASRSGTVQSSGKKFSVPVPSKNVKVTELDILSSLPETQAHYRPLPPRKHELGGEEDTAEDTSHINLEDIGLKKLQRTQVYAGRRQGVTEVKPLFDLCMQLLIENIDALDCVGGVPYDILKPVLERCTAQQLYHLEYYNPHFLEDTDELWEKLCHRDFRGYQPEELEMWREMYLRRHNEREIKYQKLKETMSSTIVKGQTGRKAQLAYVDSVAKPPRDVLRKQLQFGTGCVKKNKAGVKIYQPSATAPVHNPMMDKVKPSRPVPPMMAQAIRMRKNMRR
ncbi:transcription elongation factor b polypeptide 3 [Plakobranchus ocellatus]|uniref:Transcription elongation factor b polypeptide 3 n=1 Tax=Plakobranchus ocellatus TaxID=259542 RepID=A0AAV4B6Z5_9GAST|nr:transcription elongation factor b polypeptide 3 [Plakobranchus ocellatus]